MANNTSYGTGALQNNTSGINDTAIGAYSAYNNTDGSNNTAIGTNSSFFTTSGANNTSLGAGSLCNNTTGSLNTAIGSSALEGSLPVGSVGDKNTAIGVQALYSNMGDLNTALGAYAALGVTGGSFNTFLGSNSSTLNNISYNYSTAIGYGAIIDASNQIMMGGNASGSYPNVIIPGLANYATYIPSSYDSDTLVPKQYVDQYVSGISIKGPVTAISSFNVSGSYNSTAPGSITAVTPNPLIIDGVTIQDGSGVLLNGQIDPSHNGVYTWSPGTSTLTRRAGLQNGESAAAAYIFVRDGSTYAKTSWVQVNNPAIVGDSSLNFVEFYNFDYKLGRGLDAVNTGGVTYINVDTSLNFINFLDSNTSDPSANGTLSLGTNTNNKIVIGPTGTSVPIQAQSIIQAQQGITGATGSFNNLYVTNKAQFVQDISVNTLTIGLGSGNISSNTAIGNSSLSTNTTGTNNTAIGYQSLQNNTTGYDNTAIGTDSLSSNTTANYNTAIGHKSLLFNSIGSSNTSVGYSSMYRNTGGVQNTVIGWAPMYNNTTGNNNTSVGFASMYSNTTGNNNTALGFLSLWNNTDGSYNSALGYNAGYYGNYLNSTSIGAYANPTSSNQIMLGGQSPGIFPYPQVVAPGGITGATGSFTNLTASQQIIAPGGITGATGSFQTGFFQYLTCNNSSINVGNGAPGNLNVGGFGSLTFDNGGSFTMNSGAMNINSAAMNLSDSNINQTGTPNNNVFLLSNFPSGITGATGSFTNLTASQQIISPGGITGATGSFSNLTLTNAMTGSGSTLSTYLEISINGTTYYIPLYI